MLVQRRKDEAKGSVKVCTRQFEVSLQLLDSNRVSVLFFCPSDVARARPALLQSGDATAAPFKRVRDQTMMADGIQCNSLRTVQELLRCPES